MDNRDSAITPGRSLTSVLADLKADSKKIDPNINPSDAALSEINDLSGWKEMKKYMEGRIAQIRDLARGEIGKESFEAIGIKSVIADMVEDEFRMLMNRVENARRVVDENKKD